MEQKTAEQEQLYQEALAEKSRLDAEYEELQRNSQEITAMIQRMEQEGRMMASAHGSGQFTWPCYGKSRLLLAGASTPFGVRKSSMPESISVPTMGSPLWPLIPVR